MYTLDQIEAGEGLYTNRRTTIWLVGDDQYVTTCDGENSGGECVGFAWPADLDRDCPRCIGETRTPNGHRIDWV